MFFLNFLVSVPVFFLSQIFCDTAAYLQDYQDLDQQLGESKNSGQFVTAPSSPKQRFFSQSSNSSPYSFAFPSPEQQFQAQLLQKLQNLSGYQTSPYSVMSPNIYQTMPSGLYSIYNTFPQMKSYKSSPTAKAGSSGDGKTEDPLRNEENFQTPVRLDPPPANKKTYLEPKKPRTRGNSPGDVNIGKSRPQPPTSISIPTEKTAVQATRPLKSPTQSPKAYQNAFASALSSFKTLRKSDNGRKVKANERPNITRSTSEKVSNRSELMDLVQRTAWARQTKWRRRRRRRRPDFLRNCIYFACGKFEILISWSNELSKLSNCDKKKKKTNHAATHGIECRLRRLSMNSRFKKFSLRETVRTHTHTPPVELINPGELSMMVFD